MTFVCEVYPEKIKTLPADLFQSFMTSIQMAISEYPFNYFVHLLYLVHSCKLKEFQNKSRGVTRVSAKFSEEREWKQRDFYFLMATSIISSHSFDWPWKVYEMKSFFIHFYYQENRVLCKILAEYLFSLMFSL